MQMWCLGTWFSGGLGSVTFKVGLDDLKGLFQPKLFYESMINVPEVNQTTHPSIILLQHVGHFWGPGL